MLLVAHPPLKFSVVNVITLKSPPMNHFGPHSTYIPANSPHKLLLSLGLLGMVYLKICGWNIIRSEDALKNGGLVRRLKVGKVTML